MRHSDLVIHVYLALNPREAAAAFVRKDARVSLFFVYQWPAPFMELAA